MKNKKNLLVTLADKNYLDQAKQLFSSVYWNAGWKGDYMLLAHEIPEKDLKWFRDKGILIKECKPLYDKKIGKDEHPEVVLDKFYLFTPEFKKWKNIIYLDADIIVRASLDDLLRSKKFCAVTDIYFDKIDGLKKQFNNNSMIFKEINKEYNLNAPSFNAGFFVFSTDIIEIDSLNCLNNLLKKYSGICCYGEQTILNLFFYDKWFQLPQTYNICINYVSRYLPKKAIIFHFAGINDCDKPWDPKNSFYKEWKSNLDKAELINLNNIPEGKKWTKPEIYFSHLSFVLKPFLFKISSKIKRLIGKISLLIKKINPDIYYKLKKIKDGK